MSMRSRRLFVVVLVAVALVLSAATYVGFQAYQDDLVAEHRTNVDRSADVVRADLDARLSTHRQTVELWAGLPAVDAHGSDRQHETIRRLVDETAFSGVSVVAANGTMTALVSDLPPAERDALVGTDLGDRTYVQRALAGETYVSSPVAAETGNDVVTVSAPVRRDGEVVATLNAAFHLPEASLFEAATRNVAPSTGVTVTTADGTVVYETPPTPNESLTTSSATLTGADWTVAVSESRAGLQSDVRWLSFLQAASIAGVLAAVAGFGWWNYRRNLRQVEALLDGFDALRNGEYGTHVDVGGAEEWDRIGRGFDEMSDTVRRSVAESRERARQLKVLDRVLRHTLRNELNVVRGRAELLADAGDAEVADHGAQIIERCDALLSTAEKQRAINEVLDADTTAEPCDAARVVESAVESVRTDYPEAAVALDVPERAYAVAVPQFETAVRELVENGIRHADRDPAQVAVDVTVGDDAVRISVTDRGPGIPEMERRVLTGEDDIDALHHSQGLGLWLVHWTVTYSGGRLAFADNEPTGTVVTVSLPTPPNGA